MVTRLAASVVLCLIVGGETTAQERPPERVALVIWEGADADVCGGAAAALRKARLAGGTPAFDVFTVGPSARAIRVGGITITPDFRPERSPAPDVVVVGSVRPPPELRAWIDLHRQAGRVLEGPTAQHVRAAFARIAARCGVDAARQLAKALEMTWTPPVEGPIRMRDVSRLLRERSVSEVALAFSERASTEAGDVPNEASLNELGYGLLRKGEARDALAVFRLNVALHPTSANAADSLSELFEVRGRKEEAARFARLALKLLPGDRNIAAALKKRVASAAQRRLQRLDPRMRLEDAARRYPQFPDHAGPLNEAPVALPEAVADFPGVENAIYRAGPVYISGQPDALAFERFRKEGVRVVINLRTHREMDNRAIVPFDEANLLERLGMTYVHIPLGDASSYRPEAVDQFAAALAAHEGKALLHCTVAMRTSWLWAAYLVRHRGTSVSEALRHGRRMELGADRLAGLVGGTIESRLVGSRSDRGPAPSSSPVRLVNSEWLAARSEPASVLDARDDVHAYLRGHVPGAVHLTAESLRGSKNGIPVQLLEPDRLRAVFEKAGIPVESRRPIVVYAGSDDVLSATLVAYVLQRVGCADVRLLDGGYAGWCHGRSPTQEYPTPAPSPRPRPLGSRTDLSVDLDEVKRRITSGDTLFVDARPPKVYRGDAKIWQRHGHIPGAINLPWTLAVTQENRHTFRPIVELRALLEARGVTRDRKIVVYCGTGREASLLFHVMRSVLEYPDVRLYEGSWTEYAATELPVESGPGVQPAGKRR